MVKEYQKTPVSFEQVKDTVGSGKIALLFMYILYSANPNKDTSKPIIYNTGSCQLKAYYGELNITLDDLSKKTGFSKTTVRRYLKKYEDFNLIKKTNKGRCTLIKVLKFAEFT